MLFFLVSCFPHSKRGGSVQLVTLIPRNIFQKITYSPFLSFVPSNENVLEWDIQDGKMAVRVFNNRKINFGGLFQGLSLLNSPFNHKRES